MTNIWKHTVLENLEKLTILSTNHWEIHKKNHGFKRIISKSYFETANSFGTGFCGNGPFKTCHIKSPYTIYDI